MKMKLKEREEGPRHMTEIAEQTEATRERSRWENTTAVEILTVQIWLFSNS